MDINCKYNQIFMEFSFAQFVNTTVDSSIYFKHVKVKIFSDLLDLKSNLIFHMYFLKSEANLISSGRAALNFNRTGYGFLVIIMRSRWITDTI